MSIYMPAEWEPHQGTIMIWCERPGSWPHGAKYAAPVFKKIILSIAEGEKVYLSVSPKNFAAVKKLFKRQIAKGSVILWEYSADDCWARDTGPTFTVENGKLFAVDWAFNAWGGEYNGLYPDYKNDDAFASFAAQKLNTSLKNAHPFVLEGGSIHSNGKGVILTTEECLLSKGRNPNLSKEQIEGVLKSFLGAKKIIWLKGGVVGDETDGHVDNICAFIDEKTVLLGWDDSGEQGEICRADLKILTENGIDVIKLPMPKPVTVKKRDVKGYEYAKGEAQRSVGERLAASYVNFYISNACVLVPAFGGKNDKIAARIIKRAFPGRKIVKFNARPIIAGGGCVHCLTRQIPKISSFESAEKGETNA